MSPRFKSFAALSRRKPRRKNRLPAGCIGVILLALILLGLLSNKVEHKPPSSDPRVREVGSYRENKATWKVLLVPQGLNKSELIDLARDVHARHPAINFDLFDNDSQMAAYLEHQNNPLESYMRPEQMKYKYPKEFVLTHRIARITMVHDRTDGKFIWRLMDGVVESHLVVDDSSHTLIDLE